MHPIKYVHFYVTLPVAPNFISFRVYVNFKVMDTTFKASGCKMTKYFKMRIRNRESFIELQCLYIKRLTWAVNSLRPSDAYTRQYLNHHWSAPSHYLNQCWNIVIRTLRTKFSEILSKIHTLSFKKMHRKMSSGNWRPFLSRPQCVKKVNRNCPPVTGHARGVSAYLMKLSFVCVVDQLKVVDY